MAIDRTWAIKRPFTYPAFRKRLPLVVAITLLLLGIESTLSSIFYMDDSSIVTASSLIIAMTVILVAYPMIIYDIYKRRKSQIGVSQTTKRSTTKDIETTGKQSSKQER